MALDLVLMEFADGSKAACEYELKVERSEDSLSFVWREKFVIHGEPGSHAAQYVEERKAAKPPTLPALQIGPTDEQMAGLREAMAGGLDGS